MNKVIRNIVLIILGINVMTLSASDATYITDDFEMQVLSRKLNDEELEKAQSFINYLKSFSFIYDAELTDNQIYIITNRQNIPFVREKTLSFLNMSKALSNDCCCPKYIIEVQTRNTVTCSDGTYTDSGWIMEENIEHCGDKSDYEGEKKNCSTTSDPGDHYGVDDLNCTECDYTRYKVLSVDSSNCCKANEVTITISKGIPGEIESLANSLASAAKAAPMISDMSFKFGGEVSVKTGEECCKEDPCAAPVSYEEYSAAISAGIDISLNIPGWNWQVSHKWNGVYEVSAKIALGPEITLSPSATASVTGIEYENTCPSCLTFNINASIGLDVKFQGVVEASIELFIWPYSTWSVGAKAELGVSTSLGADGFYKCCTCTGKGGCFSGGNLEGYGNVGFTFMGYEIEIGRSVTLLPGFQKCI